MIDHSGSKSYHDGGCDLQPVVGERRGDGRKRARRAAYDYYLTRYVLALFRQRLEQDRFQNLSLRSTSVAGLGDEFINYRYHTLIAAAVPTAVFTNFSTEPAFVEPSATWLLRWYYEVYRDIVELYHDHQGWKDFRKNAAVRVNATQGIRVTLYKEINFHVEYGFRLNMKPAPGRKELDEGCHKLTVCTCRSLRQASLSLATHTHAM